MIQKLGVVVVEAVYDHKAGGVLGASLFLSRGDATYEVSMTYPD